MNTHQKPTPNVGDLAVKDGKVIGRVTCIDRFDGKTKFAIETLPRPPLPKNWYTESQLDENRISLFQSIPPNERTR